MNLKGLFKVFEPKISKEQALEIARNEFKKRKWGWLEPVDVKLGFLNYRIWTDPALRDEIGWIVIDKNTGKVKRAGYVPR